MSDQDRDFKEYDMLFDILKQEHERHNHYNRTFLTALAIVLGAVAFIVKEGVSGSLLAVLCVLGFCISVVWFFVTKRIRFDTELRFLQIRKVEERLGWQDGIYSLAHGYFIENKELEEIKPDWWKNLTKNQKKKLKQPCRISCRNFKVGWTGQALPVLLGIAFIVTGILLLFCEPELVSAKGDDYRERKIVCRSLLQKAATMGKVCFLEQAVCGHCNIDAVVKNGKAPLHLASELGRVEIARLLLDHGADVNNRRGAAQMPLHFAAMHGHVEIVRLLIDRGADINAPTQASFAPLHIAVTARWREVVELLLERGANPESVNSKSIQPIDIAREIGRQDLVELIERHLKENGGGK